ncbi:O-antigen ligase family protein [Hydrogenophaga sp. BPS33]|uniref:O-antigen ligase family protein n=1 Tax=Hydrogenophaga sp. BPS33 TaxID=2651974 RepID=UPI00131F5A64|nr:O-antigen ligase family protein [Hydrogenophaga sp. BPS33]QHE87332.1 O-antigen ligase family protein [Hydrogenophaga sp. BPS33]
MTVSSFLQTAAKASLVLVFFAFPVSVALANVGLLFTLLFWLLGCVWGTSWRDTRAALSNPVAVPALALFAWIALAALWSPAEGSQIGAALQKYTKFLLLPLFIGLLNDASTRRRCWQGFALAMLLTLVVTWLNVWFDFSWTRTHNQGFGEDHTVFKDYISQGLLMSLFTIMALHHAMNARTRRVRVLAAVIAGLSTFSVLFLSSGRTGYLALLVALLVYAVFAFGRQWRKLLTSIAAVVLLAAATILTSTQLQSRMQQAWQEAQASSIHVPVTSTGSRVEMSRFVLQSSLEKPLQGHGTASYPSLAKGHFTGFGWCAVVCVHPHNQFAFFLFEQGVIGLLLFLWFMAAIARQAWREEVPQRALMLAFLAIMAAANLSHSSFWLSTENHFFILMTALLMAAARPRQPA